MDDIRGTITSCRVNAGPTRIIAEVAAAPGVMLQLASGELAGAAVASAADGGGVLLELDGLPGEACTSALALRIWPAGHEDQAAVAGLGEVALPDVLTLFGGITQAPEDVAAFRQAMSGVLAKYVAAEKIGEAIGEFVGEVVRLNVARIQRESAAAVARSQAEIEQRAAAEMRLIR